MTVDDVPAYADVNAVVGGYLRDLAFAQSSQQKMFGYKRAAAAILALEVPLTDLVGPDGAGDRQTVTERDLLLGKEPERLLDRRGRPGDGDRAVRWSLSAWRQDAALGVRAIVLERRVLGADRRTKDGVVERRPERRGGQVAGEATEVRAGVTGKALALRPEVRALLEPAETEVLAVC